MITLGPIMGLSAGWLTVGAAACALPLAIHLMRRRSRRIAFPPAALVASSEARSRKGRRLRELLLLALRMLVIASMALAFDRPVWQGSKGMRGVEVGAARQVVILLDQSASMGRHERGETIFELARRDAVRLFESLNPAVDRAGVVFVKERPELALPTLTGNFAALVQRIERAEITIERGEGAAALALASSLLAGAPGGEIVILSDHQQSQWGNIDFPEFGHVVAAPAIVRPGEADNVGISGFVLPNGEFRVNEPAEIGVRVTRSGAAMERAVVSASFAGQTQLREVSFSGEHEAVVWFDVRPPATGQSELRIELTESDAFEIDNSAQLLIDAAAPLRVGLIGQRSDRDAAGLLFLRGAIEAATGSAPLSVGESGAGSKLSEFDCIVIVGDALREFAAPHVLMQYARAGGGLLWVIGSAESARQVAALEWPQIRIQVELESWREASPIDALELSRFLGVADEDQRTVVADLCANLVLPAAPFRAEAGADEIVRTVSGDPFIAIHSSASSQVILHLPEFAVTSVAASPLFPMVVEELLNRLRRSGGATNGRFVDPAESDLSIADMPNGHFEPHEITTARNAPTELWPALLLFSFACAAAALILSLTPLKHAQGAPR